MRDDLHTASATQIPLSEYLNTTYRPDCSEVLSPDDTLRSQRDRVEDYFAMGVEPIWLIDPITREAWPAAPAGYDPLLTGEFTVPRTPIRISLAEVFAELDEMQSPR